MGMNSLLIVNLIMTGLLANQRADFRWLNTFYCMELSSLKRFVGLAIKALVLVTPFLYQS